MNRRRATWRRAPVNPPPEHILTVLAILAIGLGILSWMIAYRFWGNLL